MDIGIIIFTVINRIDGYLEGGTIVKTTKKTPYYYQAVNFEKLVNAYEPPLEFMDGAWKWSRAQIEKRI